MQRTISVNSREIELLITALNAYRADLLIARINMPADELKMLIEEIEKLAKYVDGIKNISSGGTYIDGVRL